MTVGILNISGMGHSRRLARALADVDMSDFLRILEYKFRRHGTEFVKVDRWHPSSRRGSSSCPTLALDGMSRLQNRTSAFEGIGLSTLGSTGSTPRMPCELA
ncbi:MAG: transposase [Caldilineaceae bacterium SB0661_bin_34]|nr:transposase [Caldilineaceae bacterium SB0661_bin_34]